MNRIVTFGEIMLRLQPRQYQRILQADAFDIVYGGGEANVAVSLAMLGDQSVFVTKLPKHDLAQAAVNYLRRYGVDTQWISRGGDRMGIYFVEKGASQRPSKVIYDRKDSAIAEASTDEFHWEEVLRGANWFHFTGITPAISQAAAENCLRALQTAKRLGLTVSCDLNYRKNLWSREQAGQVMQELMQYVDVCIGNEEDAADVFGIRAEQTELTAGKVNHASYKAVAKQLADRFGFSKVAITLRTSISASDNQWAAMLYDGTDFYESKSYNVHIVDRVGGGDSFSAGLIHCLSKGVNPGEALEFAAAASCLKHTIEGDANLVSEAEIRQLMMGDGSGRVQR